MVDKYIYEIQRKNKLINQKNNQFPEIKWLLISDGGKRKDIQIYDFIQFYELNSIPLKKYEFSFFSWENKINNLNTLFVN